MIEILQIPIAFIIFSLMSFVPLNVNETKILNRDKLFFLDVAAFNLIINLNILLLLSILPISLNLLNILYCIFYFLLFVYVYFLKSIKKDLFIKNLKFISIFFIIFIIISINVAAELNLGWDAKYFYYIKALFYTQGQNFSDLESFTHNIYHPHFGSYLWAFFSNILPLKYEYFGRLTYVYLFCFSIFYVCHDNLKYKFLSNIIFILAVFVAYKYERFSGLQEILIFSILVILSKFYFKLKNYQNIVYIIFIIFGANLLLWIKAEGIVYATISLMIITLQNKISNRIKLYTSLMIALLILFKVGIYTFFEMNVNGQPFYNFDYILNINFNTFIYKIKILLAYVLYYGLNNFYFIAGLIVLLTLNLYRAHDEYVKTINYYFVFSFTFILFAYLLRDLPIEYFVRTTLERTIFISSGFYVFLVINFFKTLNIKSLK